MPRPALLPALALTVALATLTGCSFQAGVEVDPTPSAVVAGPTRTPPGPTTGGPTTGGPTTGGPTTSGPATSPVPASSPATSPAPASSPAASPGGAPTSTPPTACRSSQLVAELATASAPATSGTVTLTNTSRAACTLRGFGGVALARSDGSPVLSRQQRTDASAPSLLLAPGDAARSTITWSRTAVAAVGEPSTGDCEPVPTSLLVIPPDQIDDLAVPWTAGPVCDQGTLTQTPYTAA